MRPPDVKPRFWFYGRYGGNLIWFRSYPRWGRYSIPADDFYGQMVVRRDQG